MLQESVKKHAIGSDAFAERKQGGENRRRAPMESLAPSYCPNACMVIAYLRFLLNSVVMPMMRFLPKVLALSR
jgi:hypothetical protein